MAWTAPRTWTTGENVTAALLNTHLRDNMLQTAPARVTTQGDILFASGANALSRLGIAAVNKFLVGGANTPAWSDTLGDASNNGKLIVKGTNPKLQWSETDAADPNDFWEMTPAATEIITRFWDDSASSNRVASVLTPKDLILHTGQYGTGAGAVVIGSDASSSNVAAVTSGDTILSVSITTGGPAFVSGQWSARIDRIATGSASDRINFQPRDDGSNLSTSFQNATDWAENNVPGNGDIGTMTGIWYKRVTSNDTSAWQMFVSASTNSIFTYSVHMIVTSVQYPT